MKLEKGKAEERKGNMSKIFKNMIPYWKSIVIIIALLFVQAWCDLALPSYTSDIIDVGIQNNGVEHIVPEALTAEAFETAELFMTDGEADLWESIYEQDGDIYRLQVTSESELNEIDDTLAVPLIMNYQMSVMEDSEVKEHVAKPTGADAGTLEKDTLLSMRDSMEETIDTMGSSLVKSMGAAYAVSCDKAAGIDVEKIQKSYLVTAGLKMVGMALMIGIVTVLVGFFASRVGAGIGRTLREKVFKQVVGFSNAEMDKFSTASLITRSTNDIQQIQMVSVMLLRMVAYAPILGVGGVLKVMTRLVNSIVFVRSLFATSKRSSSFFSLPKARMTERPVRISLDTRLILSTNFCINWNFGIVTAINTIT